MSGDTNIYEYIVTEGKRTGKITAIDYFQKNTGVFNGDGMLTKEQIAAMKQRAQTGEKNIWHGFISFDEENSRKIDNPVKCMRLVKRNFGQFFRDMGLDPKNIDIMCALHLDRPKHLHIHFLFWEKEPKCKYRKKELEYRHKGKIPKDVIDKMHIRLALWSQDKNERLYNDRDMALWELRKLTSYQSIYSEEDVRKEILALAKAMPKEGRLTYGSKDMAPFREQVDNIVKMLLHTNRTARKANLKFYGDVANLERKVHEVCKGKIAEKNISVIDEIKADYKRRQGNLVIKTAARLKPEIFERKRKYKVNDISLKRNIGISEKKVRRMLGLFLSSFGDESAFLERDFSNRLQEIEEEMELENVKATQNSFPLHPKYDWGK